MTPASCVRFVRDHSPLVIVRARRRRRLQRTRRDTTPQGHWAAAPDPEAAAPDPEPISPTRSHSCLPACPCWFEVVHGGRAARPPPLAALLHARSHTRAPSRIPSRAGTASHQGSLDTIHTPTPLCTCPAPTPLPPRPQKVNHRTRRSRNDLRYAPLYTWANLRPLRAQLRTLLHRAEAVVANGSWLGFIGSQG